ncbi:MAG: hypothetical protein J6S23_06960 [Clostridia bacterium]|nr:hypothetical protein [Clostridia bacterium]
MKIIKIIALCLIVVCFFASCSNNSDKIRNTGILANDEAISSIKQEIEDKENSYLAAEGDVFWTSSGTNWHQSYKCSYLSNSKTIYHGTIEEAKLEGKVKACERCSKVE